jgi:hypothetical protein
VLTTHGLEVGGLSHDAAAAFLNGYIDNPQNWNQYTYVRNNPVNLVDPNGAAADGHHLFPVRDALGGLARNFADAIKTGPLSGNGAPNQPGFNAQHAAYNEAVQEVLEDIENTVHIPRNNWNVAQGKDAANQILNSSKPAIKGFLDDLETNNPGARAALAAAISAYRLTAARVAAIVSAAMIRIIGSAMTDFVFFVNTPRSLAGGRRQRSVSLIIGLAWSIVRLTNALFSDH